MACILAYAAAETAVNSIDRRASMLALAVVRSSSTSHFGGEDKSSLQGSRARRFYSKHDSNPVITDSALPQTKRSSLFSYSNSIVSPMALLNSSTISSSSSPVSSSLPSTAFSSMPSVFSFHRRSFHTSTSSSVIFKSSIEISIPKTNFFDYVLGDISGAERKPAVTDGQTGRTISYGELKTKSMRLGQSMMERGYRRGDVVAIWSPNVIEYVITFFGCAYVGITVTLLNPLEKPSVIRNQLFETNAKALFVFPLFAQDAVQITKNMPAIRDVFLYGLPFVNNRFVEVYRRMILRNVTTSYFSVLLRTPTPGPNTPVLGEPFERPHIDPENDILMLPFSSGTTGLPKGVIHTHSSAISYVEIIVQNPPLLDMFREDQAMGIESSNLALLPFFHIFGFAMICMCFRFRGRNVTNLRYQRRLFLRTIQKYKIRGIPVVPTLLDFMAKHPLVEKYDLSSVRLVFCGAAPLSKLSADLLMTKHPNIKVEQGYGMTEGAVSGTLDPSCSYASAGNLLPNNQAKIIDLVTGEELDHNEVGELVIHSPSTMKGYWMNPVATEESFLRDSNGKKWLKTGDVGYFDDSMTIYLVDRIKEMIKYKGNQVSPVEVELEIRTFPGVSDAAVIGIPAPDVGEVPLAFVVTDPNYDVTEEMIKDHIKQRMVSYNQLRGGVYFVDPKTGIPRSIAGKIQRKDLKVMAQKVLGDRGGNAMGGVAAAGSGGNETVESAAKRNSRSNSNSVVEKLSECSVEGADLIAGQEEIEEGEEKARRKGS